MFFIYLPCVCSAPLCGWCLKFGTKNASLLCCQHPRAGIMASDRSKGTAVASLKHLQSYVPLLCFSCEWVLLARVSKRAPFYSFCVLPKGEEGGLLRCKTEFRFPVVLWCKGKQRPPWNLSGRTAIPEQQEALQWSMANKPVSLKTNKTTTMTTEFPNTEAMESGEKTGRESCGGIPGEGESVPRPWLSSLFMSAYMLGFSWMHRSSLLCRSTATKERRFRSPKYTF